MRETGSAIRVDHKSGTPEGIVTIANNIPAAMAMIKQALEARGCHWVTEETMDQDGPVLNVGWKGKLNPEDVQVPTELVGLFVGNGGDDVQKIKNAVGGALTI